MSKIAIDNPQRVLIIGLNYPNYSADQTVTTYARGLVDESYEMVRIHPVPKWYIEQGGEVHKFQWSTLCLQPHDRDLRQESFMLADGSAMELHEILPYEPSNERRHFLDSSPYVCRSVREFQQRWEKDGTSLAIIRPAEILGIRLVQRSEAEQVEWRQIEEHLMQNGTGTSLKPTASLKCPDTYFMLSWRCDEPDSPIYEKPIRQWGLHFLYDQLANDPDRDKKVVGRMNQELDLTQRDVYFFLETNGRNNETDTFDFELMDSYRPKKL